MKQRTQPSIAAGLAALLLVGAGAGMARADDDDKPKPGSRAATQLSDLVLGTPTDDYGVSQKDYSLKAGQAYRLKVTAAGFKEYMFRAPELFRDSWIRQIVINDLEVHTSTFYGIEFDRQGTIEIHFTPQRPGVYQWFIPGFEKRGMTGTFQVK